MTDKVTAAAAAGKISATDATALDSALDSIDSSLKSGATADTKGVSGMKERIDSLIDKQVSAGTLTDDQAAELKGLFAQGAPGADQSASSDGDSTDTTAAATDVASATAGSRPMHVHGGPPPGPPPSDSDSSDSDDASSDSDTSVTASSSATATASSSSTTSTASTDDSVDAKLKALMALLESLRTSMQGDGTYGSSSRSASNSSSSSGTLVSALA